VPALSQSTRDEEGGSLPMQLGHERRILFSQVGNP
jgi:hypothetical protein